MYLMIYVNRDVWLSDVCEIVPSDKTRLEEAQAQEKEGKYTGARHSFLHLYFIQKLKVEYDFLPKIWVRTIF